MQQGERGIFSGLWLALTAIGLSVALAVPSANAAGRKDKSFLDSFDRMAIHGYVDNFTVLRNDTFKTDYHVASSRYRASVQLAGPLYMFQDYFDRFEYFIELRPEYESIYDIDDKFGTGRKGEGKRFVSGRLEHPSAIPFPFVLAPNSPFTPGLPDYGNVGLLRFFELDPGHYGEFWPKEPVPGGPGVGAVRFLTDLVPGSKYGVPGRFRDSRPNAYYGLDASQNDLRFGLLRETNMDLYYPVREAYLDFFWKAAGGRNWLRIGKQQHVWGKADFFRLQDIVNPVNFGDHFFIDLFDDTRVPLWSALFEHRFGNIGALRDVAGSVVYVFDRHTPTGLGHPAQPWATSFGSTIDGFAFGNDLFSRFTYSDHTGDPSCVYDGNGNLPAHCRANLDNEARHDDKDRTYVPFLNMALYKNRAPHWNLRNGGIGMRWEATVGNLRVQLTDYFAFGDLPVVKWDRINVAESNQCANTELDGSGESILPEGAVEGSGEISDGGTSGKDVFGNARRIGVKPKQIRVRDAAAFKEGGALYGSDPKLRHAYYKNLCQLGGSLAATWRKTNTLGLSLDWFEPYTGFVIRWESAWVANALLNDTTKIDLVADGNIFKWVLGIDRPTLIRWLNPTRSFFLSAQAYGTHYPDTRGGRYGITSEQNNFIFTALAQNQFMRDQLVYLIFAAYGTAGQDATTGGNVEYLITNNWSVQVGVTAFIGERRRHHLDGFAGFTGPDPNANPFTEAGFGLFHMQAGGSERNQKNEFWGKLRYRF